MRRSVLVLSTLLTMGMAAAPAVADPGFTELSRLPGDLGSRPSVMNDAGEVAGESITGNARHAVRWSRDGKATRLPDLGGGESMVTGLNNSGTAIGAAARTTFDWPAVRWDGDQITVLATPPGVTATGAWGISETGVIVGSAVVGQERKAVKWVDNRLTVLATPPGAWTANASKVNDRGVIAGTATFADNSVHVVRWDAQGRVSDLGSFGGPVELRAINASGVVVGSGYDPRTTQTRPFRSNASGGLDDLGVGSGGSARAYDINDFGDVVGDSLTKEPRWLPEGWRPDGSFRSLEQAPGDPADLSGSRVLAINNAGLAVGESRGFPVRWNSDDQLVVLPKKPGGAASASLVNRSGLTAGIVHDGGFPQAVLWR
ncbi:hypothetical protein ACIA8G_13830 [Lentzea sp. NPDC051213]|uniref:hypothetical protein n=1 Tax=Lentzea sp. NPDC051213 TaxID=3364126 RepID=UPI0037B812CE